MKNSRYIQVIAVGSTDWLNEVNNVTLQHVSHVYLYKLRVVLYTHVCTIT